MVAASEFLARDRRERIARARRMTPEQKLLAGPQLFALAMECMRSGLRDQHPGAGEAEIRSLMHQRVIRLRRKDEVLFDGTP